MADDSAPAQNGAPGPHSADNAPVEHVPAVEAHKAQPEQQPPQELPQQQTLHEQPPPVEQQIVHEHQQPPHEPQILREPQPQQEQQPQHEQQTHQEQLPEQQRPPQQVEQAQQPPLEEPHHQESLNNGDIAPQYDPMDAEDTGAAIAVDGDDKDVQGHIATADRVPLFSWGSESLPAPPSVDSSDHLSEGFDSRMGSLRSSTASVTSSIYNFVEEDGRTYHRYKEGKYHLPNDAFEQDRLDLQHAIYLMTTGGRLCLAPIGNDLRTVLDIGTGTGIWAIEFAQLHPGTQVIGTDLSPIQPNFVPSNCRFEIDDADDDWTFSNKFDFIHARAMISCFSDHKKVIQSCYDGLAPGGWCEWQDFIFPARHLGPEPEGGTHIIPWSQLIIDGGERVGRLWTNPARYKRFFEEVGFVNVVERRFFWPAGLWARGDYYKSIGAYFVEDIDKAIEPLSQKLFSFLGMSKEAIADSVEGFRQDMRNPKVHCYFDVTFVYGQKPHDSPPAPTHEPPVEELVPPVQA